MVLGVLMTNLKPKIFYHVQFFVKANFIGEKKAISSDIQVFSSP
jgi:hypothetical protein